MKYKLLVSAVTILVISSVSGFAAQPLQLQIDQIKAQQQQLQQQLAQLQGNSSSGGLVYVGEVGGKLISAKSSRFGRDLGLLKSLQKAGNQAPLLTLGGVLEANASYGRSVLPNSDDKILSTNGFAANQNSSSVWLDTARLDVLARINDWVNTDLQLDLHKSTVLRTGVLTIGNLNESPMYFTLGKMYPYFGDFSGHNTSTNYPLTTNYFRIKAISGASLGFYQSGLNSSLTVFKNQAQLTQAGTTPIVYSASNNNHINDWIFNTNYSFNVNNIKAKVGVGYIADLTNVSDSSIARGQIFEKNGEQLPAWNMSGQLAIGPISFKANYAQTTKEIARTGGGELKGYNLQAGYKFNWVKPIDILLGYSALKNTDYLIQPNLTSGTVNSLTSEPGLKNQWLLGIRAKLLRNTWGALEFARVGQYSSLTSDDTSHYNIVTADFYVKF
ncbi:LbtU family siderophore porin [Piscirickettsia litoralis]|uniref:Porin n=1 Tax=Piscirickettsia litoralis TaxID=1891921 RepID=A0ABX2ZZY8_9GAMM|nr:LbtU family siderophore porin [Piscirickettsia litoralis]ODN41790.1 hypothetical protein BGC07_00840 [Piscirickettsia litoralis]